MVIILSISCKRLPGEPSLNADRTDESPIIRIWKAPLPQDAHDEQRRGFSCRFASTSQQPDLHQALGCRQDCLFPRPWGPVKHAPGLLAGRVFDLAQFGSNMYERGIKHGSEPYHPI